MRTFYFITILVSISLIVKAQEFPGDDWEYIKSPSEYGFSQVKLNELMQFVDKNLETSTLLVIHKGKVLFEYGNSSKKYMVRSARKSFLASIYGIYINDKLIYPQWNMGELKITDFEPLTDIEKTATIEDCLMARSGIYLPAESESSAMLSAKPKRGSYIPGEFWCYNNWDFNVLATILQSKIGKGFFTLFKMDIAEKIGMKDFKISDGTYYQYMKSIHPAYHFRMSGKSMARFGYLMLNNGKWIDEQVIPEDWVKRITEPISDATSWGTDAYGYMWWVSQANKKYKHFASCDLPEGSYSARGALGQYLIVIPQYDLVIVHQVDSNKDMEKQVSSHAMGYVINRIFEAGNLPFLKYPKIRQRLANRIIGEYELGENLNLSIAFEDGNLFAILPGGQKEILLPLNDSTFITTRNAITFQVVKTEDGNEIVHLQQLDRSRQIKKL